MVLKEIEERRSIRSYLPKPVEEEKLKRIMEAGRLAPSARNLQNWQIIIVDNPQLKEELIDKASPYQPFLKEAPIILVPCALRPDDIMMCGHPSFLIDLSIVLDHISLQAVKEGLGTCWIGSFFEDKVREVLNIPENIRIIELMSLGYFNENPAANSRKSLEVLFKRNSW